MSLHLRYGMIMFIASEVMFFVAWFWAFFDASLFPDEVAAIRARRVHRRRLAAEGHRGARSLPPAALQHHHPAALGHDGHLGAPRAAAQRPQGPDQGPGADGRRSACCSRCVQAYEYMHAPFSFQDSIYGATFFMATGFHGFHVLIGTIFLIVCLLRAIGGDFTPKQHFGFEAAAWYWHFVDVVWLFLFASIYVWASAGATIAHGTELIGRDG